MALTCVWRDGGHFVQTTPQNKHHICRQQESNIKMWGKKKFSVFLVCSSPKVVVVVVVVSKKMQSGKNGKSPFQNRLKTFEAKDETCTLEKCCGSYVEDTRRHGYLISEISLFNSFTTSAPSPQPVTIQLAILHTWRLNASRLCHIQKIPFTFGWAWMWKFVSRVEWKHFERTFSGDMHFNFLKSLLITWVKICAIICVSLSKQKSICIQCRRKVWAWEMGREWKAKVLGEVQAEGCLNWKQCQIGG